MKPQVLIISMLLSGTLGGYSEGFMNLYFEQATIVAGPSGGVITSNALPGWSASIYGFPQSVILYDDITLGAAAVSIQDANGHVPILQGQYSVLLQGQFPSTSPSDSAVISQIGQIPNSAKTLSFYGVLGSLQITFNSHIIPYSAIGSGLNYTIYGGDVSGFAGQTGELSITALNNGSGLVDNIQFSNQAVPEPGMFGLSALGALLLGWRVLKRRR
jgi:hypothetical protein